MKRSFFGRVKDGFNRLKKNRILYTFLVTVLAFNMVIVTSFAWLTMSRRTTVDKLGMGLAVDDTSAVYEAYMYDLETGKGTNLHKEIEKDENGETILDENGLPKKKVEPLTITNIDLNQYDTIFKAQNKYTPVFARIKITRSEAMPTAGKIYITIERESKTTEQMDKEKEGLLTEYTSSIVRFTGFVIPDKADRDVEENARSKGEDPIDALYNFINSSIIDEVNQKTRFEVVEDYKGNEYSYSKTFVSSEPLEKATGTKDHTHKKTNSITIEVEYSSNDWYVVVDNGAMLEILNVYLYMTYDPNLIDCYMEDHGGGALSLDDKFIDFENDMTRVTVSYEKATN